MRYLITGIAGLIGSHLADYQLARGHEVIGIDNLSIGKKENINPKATFYQADCQDFEAMDKIMQKERPEIVYHLAAHAHEGLSQFSPVKITENNYQAHIAVLTAAIKSGARRYILGSSMSVYGSQTPPFDETMERKPEDIYAVSKTAMEQSTEILSKVHGFEYVIVRPHNVYGERQMMDDPYRNVVGIFINRCMANEPCYVYGDGEQKRAFTYIDDILSPLAQAGLVAVNGEIFNLGPTEEYTINQLLKVVRSNFDKTPEPVYLPARPLEVKDAWSTNNKATYFLWYKTNVTLEQGVAKMVRWAKSKGYQQPKYQDLEIVNEHTPRTWVEKLL